jgi:hypothetical protein
VDNRLIGKALFGTLLTTLLFGQLNAAETRPQESRRPPRPRGTSTSFYDIHTRTLIDAPTAGTLPRGYFNIGVRLYPNSGALAYTDIGLSSRMLLGLSYGGEEVLSSGTPDWNPDIRFNLKFRLVDELEFFPSITVGFNSQGMGTYSRDFKRYAFKSKGFYAVASRSFYFYKWTSGWHGGVNYSLENKVDQDKDIDFFLGFDATFDYNLAYMMEYDFGLNDDRGSVSDTSIHATNFSGKGRGYLNLSVKWLFTENLEMELIFKDLFVNRRESTTFSRELRFQYIDHF